MGELDIKSSTVDKGLDLAKTFLEKLITPAAKGAGLLFGDSARLWQFKNQVNMLAKAKAYCEKKGISPKVISMKLLCPLLEHASLEEDEELQDRWAILLGNLVDSDQNIENHVFPYLLSQISLSEFAFLEKAARRHKQTNEETAAELEDHLQHGDERIQSLKGQLSLFEQNTPSYGSSEWSEHRQKVIGLDVEISRLKRLEDTLKYRLDAATTINEYEIKPFELANLIRHGAVRATFETTSGDHEIEIENDTEARYLKAKLEVEVNTEVTYELTELGYLFIQACTEKAI